MSSVQELQELRETAEKQLQELKERSRILQAYLDGKTIQTRRLNDRDRKWVETSTPRWLWKHYDYRIAREKMQVELMAFRRKGVLVPEARIIRDSNTREMMRRLEREGQIKILDVKIVEVEYEA